MGKGGALKLLRKSKKIDNLILHSLRNRDGGIDLVVPVLSNLN